MVVGETECAKSGSGCGCVQKNQEIVGVVEYEEERDNGHGYVCVGSETDSGRGCVKSDSECSSVQKNQETVGVAVWEEERDSGYG